MINKILVSAGGSWDTLNRFLSPEFFITLAGPCHRYGTPAACMWYCDKPSYPNLDGKLPCPGYPCSSQEFISINMLNYDACTMICFHHNIYTRKQVLFRQALSNSCISTVNWLLQFFRCSCTCILSNHIASNASFSD